jgi:hypothetical protein
LQQDRVVRAVTIPFERHPLPCEQAADDLERLDGSSRSPVERQTERLELGAVPPCAQTEGQPSSADLVHGGCHLGEDRRMAERGAGNERSESDSGGRGRDRGEERERFQGSSFRTLVAVEQVIAHPDRVEPGLFRRPGHGEVLPDRDLPLGFRKLDPYPWPSRHPPEHTAGTSRRRLRRR